LSCLTRFLEHWSEQLRFVSYAHKCIGLSGPAVKILYGTRKDSVRSIEENI